MDYRPIVELYGAFIEKPVTRSYNYSWGKGM